jgi:hypothetical protein
MKHFFFVFLLRPLIDWFIVCWIAAVIQQLFKRLGKVRQIVEQGRQCLMRVPMHAKMVEMAAQIKRADGTLEPPVIQRAYRNPFKQWAWVVKSAFTN